MDTDKFVLHSNEKRYKLIVEGKKVPPFLRLFEARWAVAVGGFSYSLYLTHGTHEHVQTVSFSRYKSHI